MREKTIFFLGHSLMEFFDWQKRFPVHKTYNLGVAGETVEGLLSRTGEIIRTYPHPDLIFIMTGINNVAMEDFDFLDTYGNIIRILSTAYPECRIIVNSILPTTLDWVPDELIWKVNRSIEKIAGENGAEFLDVHSAFVEEGKEGLLLPDGVHLNDKGYALWSGAIEKTIS
jgi:lysophospholipase L1-like esterase